MGCNVLIMGSSATCLGLIIELTPLYPREVIIVKGSG